MQGRARSPRSYASRRRIDFGLVVLAALGSFLVASRFELHEFVATRLVRLEAWQADELPFAVTVLVCGLAWYAMRRRREVQEALDDRTVAEAHARDLLEQNRELTQRLISLQESERQSLARELHDDLSQTCTAIRVETAYLRHCDPRDRVAMLAAADRADDGAVELAHLIRHLLRRLRPIDLDTLGLESSLQSLCTSWSTRTGLRCDLRYAAGPDEEQPTARGIVLYRVVQEALTNVARHADATRVDITLERHDQGDVQLVIVDDGRGMDVERVRLGFGLLGARERVAAAGGELRMATGAAGGLRIEVRIPDAGGPVEARSDAGFDASLNPSLDTARLAA